MVVALVAFIPVDCNFQYIFSMHFSYLIIGSAAVLALSGCSSGSSSKALTGRNSIFAEHKLQHESEPSILRIDKVGGAMPSGIKEVFDMFKGKMGTTDPSQWHTSELPTMPVESHCMMLLGENGENHPDLYRITILGGKLTFTDLLTCHMEGDEIEYIHLQVYACRAPSEFISCQALSPDLTSAWDLHKKRAWTDLSPQIERLSPERALQVVLSEYVDDRSVLAMLVTRGSSSLARGGTRTYRLTNTFRFNA